jgi:hypothetical protein
MLQPLGLKPPITPLVVWPNKLYLFHPKKKLLSSSLLTPKDYLFQTHYPHERRPLQFPAMKELMSLESSYFVAVKPDTNKAINPPPIATIAPITDTRHCPAIPVEPSPPSSPVPAFSPVAEDAGAPALPTTDVPFVAVHDTDTIAADQTQPTVPNPVAEPKYSIHQICGRVHGILLIDLLLDGVANINLIDLKVLRHVVFAKGCRAHYRPYHNPVPGQGVGGPALMLGEVLPVPS